MKADSRIEVRSIAKGVLLVFGLCVRRCSLSCSGSGRTGLRIGADRPQTIATVMLLIPGILPSTLSGPVLRTVQIRSRRMCRLISPTALPITP